MFKLGLRARFFLYSNTVIAVTMALVTFFWMLHERRSQREAIERRGRSVVEAMAIPITDALTGERPRVTGDVDRITGYIAELIQRNHDFMLFVVVTDATGVVTHSSNQDLVGGRLKSATNTKGVAVEPGLEIRQDERGIGVLEVREPLEGSGHFLGMLAIGFSLEPIERQVAVVARRAALVAVILMLFNSALTALYVETLIRPILTLNEIMKYAGRGVLSVRSVERRGDEVGELSDAFNRMMDELEDAREREKVQRAQLAHTEKMVAVGTLAAGVAHEVNNPLSGVLACLENLGEHPDDTEMRDRYLGLARDGLKRIERTVANLLNFSRQRDIRPEPTSVNHNLRHVTELVGYQLRRSNVEVRYDLDPDEALVMADHFQMEQLFLNLVLNAIEAMPDGGTLTMKTRVEDGRVVAEVTDSGTGIPEEIADRIFDPFFTTREVGEGTGLGLAVSDSIVAAHGGTLEVESRVGKGTTFRVRLARMSELVVVKEA
jgi:two-component system NtrC family sensor kinase